MLIAALTVISVAGCGTKETETAPDDTSDVVESVSEVGSTSDESDEPVEEDTSDVVEEIEDEVVDDAESGVGSLTTSELDIEAFEADEAKDHQFGDIGYVAQYRDIRSTTGMNSESTEDVWKYLTEDGLIETENPDELWAYGSDSYTGRWAYPTLLESEATKDLYLYDWTDSFCSYIADEGENNNTVLFCTGYDAFEIYTSGSEDVEYTFEKFGDYEVNGETIEVYSVPDNEEVATYIYKLGGFTVVIEFIGDDHNSEDLLVEVMNDIVL